MCVHLSKNGGFHTVSATENRAERFVQVDKQAIFK